MSQVLELIENLNGREPSVKEKLRIHRQLLEHHQFKTTHRVVLGEARRMDLVKDESVHLVVTSPPYFDLIEYEEGPAQLGHLHDCLPYLRGHCGASPRAGTASSRGRGPTSPRRTRRARPCSGSRDSSRGVITPEANTQVLVPSGRRSETMKWTSCHASSGVNESAKDGIGVPLSPVMKTR